MEEKINVLILEDTAAQRISSLKKEKDQDVFLRVTVESGGCAGFQYILKIDHVLQPDDIIFKNADSKLVTDPLSLGFLAGSSVYYEDTPVSASFRIRNPNEKNACGCGVSFNL